MLCLVLETGKVFTTTVKNQNNHFVLHKSVMFSNQAVVSSTGFSNFLALATNRSL